MIEIFFQQWIDVLIGDSQYIQFLSYVPKILLAVIIPVFDDLYHKVAVWLNDMGEFLSWNQTKAEVAKWNDDSGIFSENYKTDQSYEEHFILKLILVSKDIREHFINFPSSVLLSVSASKNPSHYSLYPFIE